MKAASFYADRINTVSPSYAAGFKQRITALRSDDIFENVQFQAVGNLNGIDYETNDPEKDPQFLIFPSKILPARKRTKRLCKKKFGLPVKPDVP